MFISFHSGATTVYFPGVTFPYNWCRYAYGPTYSCTGNEQQLIDCSPVTVGYASYTYTTNEYGVNCIGIGFHTVQLVEDCIA